MTRSQSHIRIIARVLFYSIFAFAMNVGAAAGVKPNDYEILEFTPDLSAYNTELFNLLLNKKNVVDGKNRFNKNFSSRFDTLLIEGRAASGSSSLNFLKKRLLSGPEPKPIYVSASGKRYIYYEACQAHACDETHLALLLDVELNSMRAYLVVDGVARFLGEPSQQEMRLLEHLKSYQ